MAQFSVFREREVAVVGFLVQTGKCCSLEQLICAASFDFSVKQLHITDTDMKNFDVLCTRNPLTATPLFTNFLLLKFSLNHAILLLSTFLTKLAA